MKLAEFHPAAAEEAEKAAQRYENSQPGLGEDFRTELNASLTRIRGTR